MGYTTDFLGHIEIAPVLNREEAAYLSAFRHTRHWDRPEGPYVVSPTPFAEKTRPQDIDAYNRPGRGTPQLWCRWEVCLDRCCLAFDGTEKFYQPVRWLRYLIEHFLAPDAHAAGSGLPAFEGFGFDHRLDGMVIGCRRDTRELFAICVQDNEVSERTLMPGLDSWRRHPPLAYTEAIDEWATDLQGWRGKGKGPRLAR